LDWTYGRLEKAITSFRNCLDIPGTLGVVAQRLSQLANVDAQAAVKIDEGIFRPDAAPQFLAADHLSRIFQKHNQKPKRLLLQLYALSIFEEFARGDVYLKQAESIDGIGLGLHNQPSCETGPIG
jgi:hypothetical protein